MCVFVCLRPLHSSLSAPLPPQGLCMFTTALLHYFLLCSLCWMLCEGVMLYLMIVKVFGTAAKRWYWFLLLGWGKRGERNGWWEGEGRDARGGGDRVRGR